jgi:hypothetical protein
MPRAASGRKPSTASASGGILSADPQVVVQTLPGAPTPKQLAPARDTTTRRRIFQRPSTSSARADSLHRLLVALAPGNAPRLTISVAAKSGERIRMTFSHPAVLPYLRRALADAEAAARARGRRRRPLVTPIRPAPLEFVA